MILISVEIFTSDFNKIFEKFVVYIDGSIYEFRKSRLYYGSTYLKMSIARNLVKITNFEFK